MKYVEIDAETTSDGITEAQKTEFFKLYVPLSRKIKKFVGRKKDSEVIKENFKNLLTAMRTLSEL